jgi:hypothetical protein
MYFHIELNAWFVQSVFSEIFFLSDENSDKEEEGMKEK